MHTVNTTVAVVVVCSHASVGGEHLMGWFLHVCPHDSIQELLDEFERNSVWALLHWNYPKYYFSIT